MKTTRRTFLFQASGAAAAAGLPALCGRHSTRRPQAPKDALARMRTESFVKHLTR